MANAKKRAVKGTGEGIIAKEEQPKKTNRKRKPMEAEELLRVIEQTIRRLAEALKDSKAPAGLHRTASDLQKLIELRKEMSPERIREVTVRWIGEDIGKEKDGKPND